MTGCIFYLCILEYFTLSYLPLHGFKESMLFFLACVAFDLGQRCKEEVRSCHICVSFSHGQVGFMFTKAEKNSLQEVMMRHVKLRMKCSFVLISGCIILSVDNYIKQGRMYQIHSE